MNKVDQWCLGVENEVSVWSYVFGDTSKIGYASVGFGYNFEHGGTGRHRSFGNNIRHSGSANYNFAFGGAVKFQLLEEYYIDIEFQEPID